MHISYMGNIDHPCTEKQAESFLKMLENKALRNTPLNKEEVAGALQLDPHYYKLLTEAADRVRARWMGDAVYLRGIIEFSNVCKKKCSYCGIRAENRKVNRYTMSEEEILAMCSRMQEDGCTTVVLQSGESPVFSDERFRKLLSRIKKEIGLAITGSVGVRSIEVYKKWFAAGLDRYLLRFETSDPDLYDYIHPDSTLSERLQALHDLRLTGIQTGSGFMVGIPGETVETVADNILLCRRLQLDMIGVGPFISHPDTPLAGEKNTWSNKPDFPYAVIALLRLANPTAHIPATTAFDALDPGSGRNRLLTGGANVFMPNVTPAEYRGDYLLYPDKPCVDETPGQCALCVKARIENLGRKIGTGPGDAYRLTDRA